MPDRDGGQRRQCLCHMVPTTSKQPGAIAVLQLVGEVEAVLKSLTGVDDWPLGRARLVQFDDIDEGLAVRLSHDLAQLMPHSGPRVLQRLTERMIELGVEPAAPNALPAESVYPEAADRYEALALAAVARAASPLAIDILLDQPRRWRRQAPPPSQGGGRGEGDMNLTQEDLARSRRLNRLIDPPIVVVAGAPNVGKSTLSNALLGRSMSIAADVPGTTRDYTSGRIELAGLVVDWYDTPGMRDTSDPIESKAIDLARQLIERADLLIAMKDHEHDWPTLPRPPDLRILNKIDLLPSPSRRWAGGEDRSPANRGLLASEPSPLERRGQGEGYHSASRAVLGPSDPRPAADLRISATHGTGISDLVTAVRDRLVPPADLTHPGPWLFDERLIQSV
ncbi:MAG: 50S ribosome-binding GTPase [Planctomycetota bacterium]|nr:50S ribosome-binding GTPase [Planctomycetota bacterium]